MRTFWPVLLLMACGDDGVGHLADAPPISSADAADAAPTDVSPDVFECVTAAECPNANYTCAEHHCVDVTGTFSGLLWQLPCGADSGAASCITTPSTVASGTVGGAPGVTYDVTVHIRGVIEEKTYVGGCKADYWQTNGRDNGDPYNIYRLTISSPPQVYFLNAGISNQQRVYALDYVQTFRVDTGATVELYANAVDGAEIKNIDGSGQPISVAGTSVAQPYSGQFIEMEVISVVPDPVPTHGHVGAGAAGNALAFDGTQLATVADAPTLQPNATTIEAWTQFTGASGSYNSVLGKAYQTGSGDSYTVWYQDGQLHAGTNVTSPAGTASYDWSGSTTWHHLAMTWEPSTMVSTLYVDGIAAACGSTSAPVYDNHAVLLGADNDNGVLNGFWNGQLDELRLWSVARTPAQIWADMHTHQLGPTTGLAAEWTFDEGTGQTTSDRSGNANTATLGTDATAESRDPTWVPSAIPLQ